MGYPRRLIGVIALALCGGMAFFYWHRAGTDGTKVSEHAAGAASSSALVHRSGSNASGSAVGVGVGVGVANQPAAPAQASATADANDSDKHAIIEEIRATLISDPKFAEELIREDRERFPDSPDADERDASLISALFNQRHMYDAQLAALDYYERHPDGAFTDYVMRETRVHPPPRRAKP